MPLEDIVPDVLQFVDNYIDGFVAWDTLAYFHENKAIERRAAGVAMDIGRRPDQVAPVLESFVKKGVLSCDVEQEEERVYKYSAPPAFRENMEKFLSSTRDRTNRLAIVSKVLQKESRRR